MPLVPFEPHHAADPALAAPVAELAKKGMAYTVVAGGEVLGVIGVAPLNGRAEVFAAGTEARFRHRVDFVKSVRRALDLALEHFGPGKVEARCDASIAGAARFLEHLGFAPLTADDRGPVWGYVR